MIQHMNLVFQAGGLKTGEGAFLMACANHTDDRGYVIAHMKQLADEAHMTLRAAQDNRARLEARGLLKSKERLNPKNRAQMANLFRINLDGLAALKRSKTDYGPTLIEELTFDAADTSPEEKPSSDPHADSAPPPADSAPPHAESAGDGGAESAPLLLPSSSPSSLSGPARPASDGSESGDNEREAAAPEGTPEPAAGGVPGPREDTEGSSGDGAAGGVSAAAESVVSAYVDAHVAAVGVQPRPYAVQRVRTDATALLAAGRDAVVLERLAAEMPSHGWTDLVQHLAKNQPRGGSGRGGGGPERCADHPARYRLGCLECAMAVPA
ncbi:hypothetical protein ABZ513_31895 [Streptomyces bacillaris]|uniref:hypothetical protein n=1 Tax=Streptomyces bacillaris TaxID=68179 RepID=UPI003460F16D